MTRATRSAKQATLRAPRAPGGMKRSSIKAFRVSEEDSAFIEDAAERMGLEWSEFLRRAARGAALVVLEQDPAVVNQRDLMALALQAGLRMLGAWPDEDQTEEGRAA